MNISRSLAALALSAFAIIALAACAPTPAAAPAPTAAPPTAPPLATTAPAATAASGSASSTALTIKLGQIQGFGLFLTDDAGRTLYAFDNDKKDTSTCAGSCLQNWPPFIVKEMPKAGDRINAQLLSTFTRADSTLQAEYDNRPLYYAGDKNPGDVNGHNVGNVWHVLSPRGSPMLNPAPTKAP
jgi:predicted lipoprotein with Yx(FWY)xxD motif